jgi:hypothetical protein
MARNVVNAAVVCSLLQVGALSAQSATDRPAVEKQIVANEKAIVDAVLKNDPKTFHSYILADSFAVASQGVIAVADFDPVMKQQATDCKVTKFEFAESRFYWVNDTTVVHMFKETFEGTCKGEPINPNWASSVWTKKNGKWLGAFHHESEIMPPPAAKK